MCEIYRHIYIKSTVSEIILGTRLQGDGVPQQDVETMVE